MKKVRVKTHAANFGEFDCTHVCDFAMSEIASANSKPESINRVYVSVFNERFLIDQEGILYARCIQGNENLCMHTEYGNLFVIIGRDFDGEPCTISDTYSLLKDCF